MDDFSLIYNIKNNQDSNSLSELTKKHTGLIHKISNKYFSNPTGIKIDEFLENPESLVYGAVKSYGEKRAQFNTWLGSYVRYAALSKIQEAKKDKKLTDLQNNFDETIDILDENELNFSNFECLKDFISYLADSWSDKRVKTIIEMRYFDKKKYIYKDIGQQLGISYQMVKNLHDHFMRFLRAKMTAEINFDKV